MEIRDYLKLKKKENKSEIEWELLKNEGVIRTIRTISEFVTDADKHDEDPRYFIDRIREYLKENYY